MTDITLPREVVKFVLQHLEWWSDDEPGEQEAIAALRAALSAPKQEHPGYVIGSHWLETAYSRICAGEAEADVLRDCGWERVDEALTVTRDRQAAMLRRLEEREAELDAEIGRLTKENERLRDELRQSSIDHTRAEIERLREQIKDCDATIEALQSAVARAAQRLEKK